MRQVSGLSLCPAFNCIGLQVLRLKWMSFKSPFKVPSPSRLLKMQKMQQLYSFQSGCTIYVHFLHVEAANACLIVNYMKLCAIRWLKTKSLNIDVKRKLLPFSIFSISTTTMFVDRKLNGCLLLRSTIKARLPLALSLVSVSSLKCKGVTVF